ncbi:hypothetical protein LY474_30645 [Myxococcus stipitatus]|uniref:hypothetical protein n=1 Tax=Myxococcus stipitatus TaxID=83455 RepID=UPI001F1A70CD|nr:hypothetical protein [Myxococcus stipitatus]MCE9672173.1 hypothetical protein [Myxococcus stipitatus]
MQLDDDIWYGSLTYVHEEWGDSSSNTTIGCATERSTDTRKGITTIDVTSNETGTTFNIKRTYSLRSDEYSKFCNECAYTTVYTSKTFASGSIGGIINADIDFEGDYAFVNPQPDDFISESSVNTTKTESCAPPTETIVRSSGEIYAEIWESSNWTTGPTPGSYILYGSRTDGGELGEGHYYQETVTWRFSNRPTVELVIDAVDGTNGNPFDTWRPKAVLWNGIGTEPTEPGALLELEAHLDPTPTSSSHPLPKATKITFKLLRSSTVPGTAMNSPLTDPQNSPRDLQFEATRNTLSADRVFVDMDTVSTPPGLHEFATATLSTFDWGAYGEVTAEALLEDGSTLVARFRGSGEPMRIPMRHPLSYIADSWKASNGKLDSDDIEDDEVLPGGGDGHTGDGLSLYEEYRGFVASGTRVDPDPMLVDFHLFNGFPTDSASYPTVSEGASLFEGITGMKVHKNYSSEDFEFPDTPLDPDPTKRIINFNALTEGHRHLVDQHLIMVMRASSATEDSNAINGPSSPLSHPLI